jgi:hypothetical protein
MKNGMVGMELATEKRQGEVDANWTKALEAVRSVKRSLQIGFAETS